MPRYRLLALDIDGTLAGRDGGINARTAEAVAKAAAAGVRPVLCTGRRYRRALPVARSLGLNAPIVCDSGAIVKEPSDHRTLWRADVPLEPLTEVLALLRDRGEPAVSILDHGEAGPDFVVPGRPTGRSLFDDYIERNAPFALVEPDWMNQPERRGHFHLFAVGARDEMIELEADVIDRLGGHVRTFIMRSPAYSGTFCEVLRNDAGKWAAVCHLGELWDIAPEEIIAIGDDLNDLPMIEGAGLGVAMGQAPDVVKAAADLVTLDHDGDGVAALIDDLLA